jgi:hypothetical protein
VSNYWVGSDNRDEKGVPVKLEMRRRDRIATCVERVIKHVSRNI